MKIKREDLIMAFIGALFIVATMTFTLIWEIQTGPLSECYPTEEDVPLDLNKTITINGENFSCAELMNVTWGLS